MSLLPPSPEEILAFRKALGLSQAAFAEKIGAASARGVQDWEAGARKPPPMLRLAMAAINAGLEPWSA